MACSSFAWYGTTYTTSGNKTRVIPNAAACDSTITLHLTINALTTANAGMDVTQVAETFTMAANSPSPGTGAWTVTSGTATIADATSPTTNVMGIAVGSSATLRWTITNGTCSTNDDVILTRTGVLLSLKVILEGPYNSGTGLMSDGLRSGGYLPITTPYTNVAGFANVKDNTTAAASTVFNTTGNDAIVDWVFIELRSKTTPATVVATRSALLQSDGDVVDVDGTSALLFDATNDNYFIAVRHRNHMGFRGAAMVTLSATAATVDFTAPSVSSYGLYSRKTIGSIRALYSGDANHDGFVNAVDRNVYVRPQNGQMSAYLSADFNFDGFVNATDMNVYFRPNNGYTNDIHQ